jgi:hypothetical protein
LLALILAVALRDPPASTAPVLPLSAADAKSRAQPAEPSAAPQRFVTTAPAPTAQKDAGPEGASPEAKPPAVASTARGPRTMLVSTKPRQPASATARANKKPAVSLVDETVDTRR